MRAVIYARYSSDNQRDASIEDQVRICRERIGREGWSLAATYTDHAISGASRLRPGYQKLLEDARAGSFDVVVAEALDRLSRDQEDVAGLYKQLGFAGIKLVTVSEGEISELHVGLKGTMNALYLKDLAQKTRRGLEGRVRASRSGGGKAYGYDVVREVDAQGDPVRGKRAVNAAEAAVVTRIFSAFASNRSPKAIAHELNREGVPGPNGSAWSPSTIYGNWRRGTGVLNNELYIGQLIWNRQRFVKDPTTGKRVAKLNPLAEWIIEDVPHLRIVPDALWQEVKARQKDTRAILIKDGNGIRAERARRPTYLLSGLLKCGECGGGASKISRDHYGCSNARNRATCSNMLTIRRDVLENSVVAGLRTQLMHPDLVKEFILEFHREMNRLASEKELSRHRVEADLRRVEREIRAIIDAIKSGIRNASMAAELDALEIRKQELQERLTEAPPPPVRLHPNLADVYRRKVENLGQALNEAGMREEAATLLRGLIDEIRLTPVDGALAIYLVGDLAAILNLSTQKHPGQRVTGVQTTLVAGACNRLNLLLFARRLPLARRVWA